MLRNVTLQGKAIWILGFFSFLAGLFAIHAIVLAANPAIGIEGTYQPWFISNLTGAIPVYAYLLISVIATLVFLGATAHRVVSELSNKTLLNQIDAKVTTIESGQKLQQQVLESLQARVFLVDESLNGMKKDVAKAFSKQGEEIQQLHADLVKKFDSELTNVKGVMTRQFIGQSEEMKKINTNLVNMFTKNLADVKDELAGQLVKMGNAMQRHEQRNTRSEKAILKQRDEIAEIKSKLERLEDEFVKPKPELASQSDVEDVRGIGETTGKELRAMGITNAGELVMSDPAVIAEKTGMSEKMVEKLQGRAQLAMVPGVKEKDLILLEEVGVTNRKELADQDPFELGKKMNAVFKVYVKEGKISEAEKPTVEEIDSWVRFARA
jgi:predicted flap endonuclease-1-like 5' DNA nuclease